MNVDEFYDPFSELYDHMDDSSEALRKHGPTNISPLSSMPRNLVKIENLINEKKGAAHKVNYSPNAHLLRKD